MKLFLKVSFLQFSAFLEENDIFPIDLGLNIKINVGRRGKGSPIVDASTGLENLATVFTQVTSWMGSIVTTITGNPIYLLGLGIWVTGAVIGLGYRLIRG